MPVSATKGTGLDELRKVILERLPEGPAYFPEDHVTDQPERFLAAELIREKMLLATRQEVPHSVAVMVDRWEEDAGAHAHLRHHPRGARRAEGHRHRRQGRDAEDESARWRAQEMEKLFGVKIYLDLHVQVQPGWREKPAFLNALDWRTMAGEDDS